MRLKRKQPCLPEEDGLDRIAHRDRMMLKHKQPILMPEAGQVSILMITDKQYGQIENFWGMQISKLRETPKQLEIF